MRIVLATSNPHKLAELRAILAAEGLADRIRLLSLDEAGGPFPEPPESGSTFEENAALKARAYARTTGLPCIADDSGLEVDALAGRPGVISSHYCTSGQPTDLPREQRDRLNNDRLLRDLAGVPLERRSARFVCVMALALPTTPPLATEPHHAEAEPFQATSGAGPFQAPRIPEAEPSPPGAGPFQAPSSRSSPESLHPRHRFKGPVQRRTTDLLPHWQAQHAIYFLTFRTAGITLLPDERTAVLDACMHWHGSRTLVDLAVVMPDHVHLIVRPLRLADGSFPSIPWLMQSIKGFTARRINQLRGRSGIVWQDEYFDRILRTPRQLDNARAYIAFNPLAAGLVKAGEHYPWLARGQPRRMALAHAPQPSLAGPERPRPSHEPSGPERPCPDHEPPSLGRSCPGHVVAGLEEPGGPKGIGSFQDPPYETGPCQAPPSTSGAGPSQATSGAGPFQATSGAGPFQAPQIPEAGPSSPGAGSFQPLQPPDSPLSLNDALATFRGTFEGRIGLPGDVPRGTHGFGYDPIFLVAPHYTRTSAELAPDEKNRLSHRAKAARQLARFLRALPFRPE
jgi:non-canonical purine NTP pyrophosphatase (RdgB/HAM1 family)